MVDGCVVVIYVVGNVIDLGNMNGLIDDVWYFFLGILCCLFGYGYHNRSEWFFFWYHEVFYFGVFERLKNANGLIETGISRCMFQVGIHQPLFAACYARCILFGKKMGSDNLYHDIRLIFFGIKVLSNLMARSQSLLQ